MYVFRYIIYGVSLLSATLTYALRLAFNSTIICQYSPNNTDHYLHDPVQRGWMFSAVSLGLLLGLAPLPRLHKLGTKNVVAIYFSVECIASLLYPFAEHAGFWPAFIVRIAQGAPCAVFLWMMNNISLEWAPKSETGLAIAILSSIYQFGPMVSMIFSGEMCSRFGWEYTYYILGVANTMITAVFYALYTNDVWKCRFTSVEEAKLISADKRERSRHPAPVPYKHVLTDPQVWLTWVLYYFFFMGTFVFLQYGPTYINQVLQYDVRSTGYTAALPHILSLFLKFFFGKVVDNCCGLRQQARMRMAFSVVELTCVACLFSLLFATSSEFALIIYVVFNALHGVVVIVIIKQAQTVAKEHAHFLVNVNTLIVALCIFLLPPIVNTIVPNNTAKEWSNLFLGVALQMLLSVVLFVCCASGTASVWTNMTVTKEESKKLAEIEHCELK